MSVVYIYTTIKVLTCVSLRGSLLLLAISIKSMNRK